MGGKPSQGTRPDKRLKENKGKPPAKKPKGSMPPAKGSMMPGMMPKG